MAPKDHDPYTITVEIDGQEHRFSATDDLVSGSEDLLASAALWGQRAIRAEEDAGAVAAEVRIWKADQVASGASRMKGGRGPSQWRVNAQIERTPEYRAQLDQVRDARANASRSRLICWLIRTELRLRMRSGRTAP
jgi:hypothetical protein